jgi:spermidine/putrescine transport system substrate-binding protein
MPIGDQTEQKTALTTSRRAAIAAAGTGLIGLSGCLGGDTDDTANGSTNGTAGEMSTGETLVVSTWSGTNETVFTEEIKPLYEEQTGNTLEVVGNWNTILSQIRSAPADDPPFDVTLVGDKDHYFGVQEGLWESFDINTLNNADVIKPNLLREDPVSVPLCYGVMGAVYDQQRFDGELGSWGEIISTASDVSLPGGFFTNALQMGALAADEMPSDEELYTESGHDVIFQTLRDVDTAEYYSSPSEMWTSLNEGIATLGQYFFAYSAKYIEENDTNFAVHVPEQTTGYTDDYHIVRGTEKTETAKEFLDFMLTEEAQTTYAQNFNLGMANPATDYPSQTEENVPLSDDELDDVSFIEYADIAEYSDDLSERFNSLKQNV